MLKEKGFYKGVNLGGWMSQCDYSFERLDGFITDKDIEAIASWGVDHVRLPVDYDVAELMDDGIERIRRAVDACKCCGLNVMLDLHKTAGFSFDAGEQESGFFDSSEKSLEYQERFYRLWECFAKEFGNDPDHVAFDLLNEITDASYLPEWKRISAECIRRIRLLAPENIIIIGSYANNDARAVKELDAPYDSRVAYNFHCYEPLAFTHQGAYWVPWLDREKRVAFKDSGATEEFFEELFSSAIAKADEYGADLYCGEYGVIDIVSPEEALEWYKVINKVFERHGISRAAWSYKEMDFGLSDARMDGVREELLAYL
ncbi:MAG: cellulase family glycosylhydrolase [Mogibacterium sp.]|nr:cellulase family glycosylhydrolase [Mogibacterium sp.]